MSIFQISPVRVTTYAVFPMNSSEVGWFRPPVMTVNVPSPLTSTSSPVFGFAGVAGSLAGRELALREAVEGATQAELHVYEQRGARCHQSGGG